jgi:hypothetical protein
MAKKKQRKQKEGHDTWTFPKGEMSMDAAVKEAAQVIKADYYADVRGLSNQIVDWIDDGEIDDEETAEERLGELVDGTQRVIYTWQAQLGMLATDNEDAWEDMEMENPSVEQRMYAAMLQDVREDLESEYGIDLSDQDTWDDED